MRLLMFILLKNTFNVWNKYLDFELNNNKQLNLKWNRVNDQLKLVPYLVPN